MTTQPSEPTEQNGASGKAQITYLVNGVPAPLPVPPPPQPDYTALIMAHIASKRLEPTTPGLDAITGIPDRVSPSASGKLMSAVMTGSIRDQDLKHLGNLSLMREAPTNARIYCEKGGTGHTYYRLRYRKNGRQSAVYLGRPPNDTLAWMKAILDENRLYAEPSRQPCSFDVQRIKMLRALLRRVQVAARPIAKAAGYSFKGYRLLRVRT